MKRVEYYIMGVRLSKEKMNQIEKILDSFLQERGLVLEPPVDVFELANKIGFQVIGADFEDPLEGLIIVDENEKKIKKFKSNKIIAYNINKEINDSQFIVAHELAHYIQKKVANPDNHVVLATREHTDTYSSNKEEQETDYLAAAILIPKNDLIKKFGIFFEENKLPFDFISNVISKYYDTNEKLAERRCEEVFLNE